MIPQYSQSPITLSPFTNGQTTSVEERSELRCTSFSISGNERRFEMVDQPPERVKLQEYSSVNRSKVNNHSN